MIQGGLQHVPIKHWRAPALLPCFPLLGLFFTSFWKSRANSCLPSLTLAVALFPASSCAHPRTGYWRVPPAPVLVLAHQARAPITYDSSVVVDHHALCTYPSRAFPSRWARDAGCDISMGNLSGKFSHVPGQRSGCTMLCTPVCAALQRVPSEYQGPCRLVPDLGSRVLASTCPSCPQSWDP